VELLEARRLLAAVVTTDHADYAPGSTVTISAFDNASPGANFRPGEMVQFQVTRTDGGSGSASGSQPWDATADATGSVQTSWFVGSQYAGAALQLTATGLASGAVATTSFTDTTTDFTSTITPNVDTASHASLYAITVSAPRSNGAFDKIDAISIAIPVGYSAVSVLGIGSATRNDWLVESISSTAIVLSPHRVGDRLTPRFFSSAEE
jgi:hypothetical protein